jgi:single-strand DNA-binding protein
MSLGFNSIQLIGNLGNDPDLKATPGGLSVCEFSLAVNERIGRGDEAKDIVTWVRVVTWNGTAESASAYLTKGRRVFVSGSLRVEQYEDKDSNQRTSVKVMARTVKFLDAPPDIREPSTPRGGGAKAAKSGPVPPSPAHEQPHADDIPF